MRADQGKNVTGNVVSIFGAKAKLEDETVQDASKLSQKVSNEEHDFAEEVRRNQQVAERMRKERQKANRSVLRSYRLKT